LSPLAKMTRVNMCKQLKLILSSIVYILIIPGTKMIVPGYFLSKNMMKKNFTLN